MRFAFGSAAMCLLVLALPLSAHHSHGNYEDAFIDLQGVVKEVHLLVPHSFVYIEVKPAKGDQELWALEGTGRTGLERVGVTKEYLEIGDTVKVRCHRLRDGTNGCLLGFMKIKDGSVKDWDGGNLAAPADF